MSGLPNQEKWGAEEWARYLDEQYRHHAMSCVVTVCGLGPVEINMDTGRVEITQEKHHAHINLFFPSEATTSYLDPIKQAIQLIAKRELLSYIYNDHPAIPLLEDQINT